ncbi:MAG: universal stress protein [Mycobacterium sp.]
MSESSSAPRVVVGVDGSRAALQAALWAADEAIGRDIPLALLYAIDDVAHGSNDVATAEKAVHDTINAIESLGQPIKMEAEIVRRHPVSALLEASRSAAMVCLGSIGFHHAVRGRIGSTATALATSAYCPVAIVPRNANARTDRTGLVLAVVDGSSASDGVLDLGVTEARLRASPLRVFTLHQSRPRPLRESGASSDQQIAAALERRIARCRREHPDLNVESISNYDGLLNSFEHLQRSGTPIQLVVVDPCRPGPLDVLLGPAGRAVMESAGCAVMTCDRTWWL